MEFVRKYLINRFLFIIVSIAIIGCAGKKPTEQLSLEERFKRGQEYLENKKFYNAQQEFHIVVLSGSHTELGDDAQFYLAESYYKNKEYLIAISEYDRLTRKMKYSPYVEQSRWRICQAYVKESPKYFHDQTNTDKALQKLQEFIDEYPNSEYLNEANSTLKELRTKLADKILKTGELYIKLHAYDSAIFAYKDLLNQYYDTDLAEEAHFGIIKSNILLKNVEEAEKHFLLNKDKIVSADLLKEAQEIINSAKVKD